MRDLVLEAVFGKAKQKARERIKSSARKTGIKLFSTQKLYEKIAEGQAGGFTVPAFNIRSLTFDAACALFRAARKEKAGAFILELAKSEIDYTDQAPEEYASSVLAACLEQNFKRPLFFQGDHLQCLEAEPLNIGELERLIEKAIKAGFYNIDIDCSHLAIEENFKQTASFTSFIRKHEPKGLTVAVGGEIGEIGGRNTTVEELAEFIAGYQKALAGYDGMKGLIKAAVQTGTAHGKGGKMDFELLKQLSLKAREYGLSGVVQHGASTLPEDKFQKFPDAGALEIHLATEFQDIILQSNYFPEELKVKVTKKTLGKFKEEIWAIPQKNIDKICEELEEKFTFFFRALKVSGTKDLIDSIYC